MRQLHRRLANKSSRRGTNSFPKYCPTLAQRHHWAAINAIGWTTSNDDSAILLDQLEEELCAEVAHIFILLPSIKGRNTPRLGVLRHCSTDSLSKSFEALLGARYRSRVPPCQKCAKKIRVEHACFHLLQHCRETARYPSQCIKRNTCSQPRKMTHGIRRVRTRWERTSHGKGLSFVRLHFARVSHSPIFACPTSATTHSSVRQSWFPGCCCCSWCGTDEVS
eukprot:SAG31_NODE_1066_length_10091_cov_5.779323_5_plen_222_part_00